MIFSSWEISNMEKNILELMDYLLLNYLIILKREKNTKKMVCYHGMRMLSCAIFGPLIHVEFDFLAIFH
jgi:hypothetical protein